MTLQPPDEMSAMPASTVPSSSRHRYAAFLSYSRAADGKLAPAVQSALHQLAKPWYRPRALRVFRDDANLSANPGLWPSIAAALDESEFFILLASPDAAASPWVAREVEHWLARHDASGLLVAVTDGEIAWDHTRGDFDHTVTSCLPEPLFGRFSNEPRWVDLRAARGEEQLSLQIPQFRDKVADLAAPLHHVAKDDLFSEDIRRHRNTRRLVRAVIVMLSTLTVLASTAAVVAVQQWRNANAGQRRAVARQLDIQAASIVARDPATGVRLALAAQHIDPGPATDAALLNTLAATRYAGTLAINAGGLNSIAYAPDGRTLATGSQDGTVTIWDVGDPSKHTLLHRWAAHPRSVNDVAFLNAQTLATASDDESVNLWDISNPTRPALTKALVDVALPGEFGRRAEEIVFSQTGNVLVTAKGDGSYVLWDLSDPTNPQPVRVPGGDRSDTRQRGHVAISSDGRTLATFEGIYQGPAVGARIQLWDIGNVRQPHRLGPALVSAIDNTAPVAFAFDPRLPRLIVIGRDDVVRLWDVTNPLAPNLVGAPFVVPDTRLDATLAITPEGTTVGFGSAGGAVVYDISDPDKPARKSPPLAPFAGAQALALAPNRPVVAVDDGDNVQLLHILNPSQPQRTGSPIPGEMSLPLLAEQHVMTWSGRFSLVDFSDSDHPTRSEVSTEWLASAPNGHIYATTNYGTVGEGEPHGQHIYLWSLSGQRISTIDPGRNFNTSSVAFTSDAATLLSDASASESNADELTFWDVSQPAAPRPRARVPIGDFCCVLERAAFSSDSHLLVLVVEHEVGGDPGNSYRNVLLWDTTDLSHPKQLSAELGRFPWTPEPLGLAFSPDGHLLAAANGTEVLLWDITRPAAPRRVGPPLTGHSANVVSVAFAPDGRTLATAARDTTVILWDLSDPSQPQRIGDPLVVDPKYGAYEVTFASTSTVLASGAETTIWRLDTLLNLRAHANEIACDYTDGLDRTQWEQFVSVLPYQSSCT
jgi:WD40 repeat protein